jgi:hypothetical protein
MNRQRPAWRGARLGQRRHPTVFRCLRRWRRRQIRARGNCLWCGHGEDVGAAVQKFDIYQGPTIHLWVSRRIYCHGYSSVVGYIPPF